MESKETEITRIALTCALGDGSMVKQKSGKYHYGRLKMAHSGKQEDYLRHKVKVFRQFFPGKETIYSSMVSAMKGGPKKYTSVEWATASPKLNAARNLLYPNGYKEITPAVLSMLGAQAIAWFYMDDGHLCKSAKNCSIAMCSHSKEEIELTKQWIQYLTGAEGVVKTEPVYFHSQCHDKRMIRFGSQQYKKFLDAIRPYAAPSMEYKFNY